MKEFACGDIVPNCKAKFRGTPEEILSAVAIHARDAHGITAVPPELVTQVQSLMRPVAA